MSNHCHKNDRWFQVAAAGSIIAMTVGVYSWIGQPVTATKASKTQTSLRIAQQADTQALQLKNLPRLVGKATVVLKIKNAPITIEVDGTNAPITAGQFVDLVQKRVYDGLIFHRVVKDPSPFVAQGGDPQSKKRNFPASQLGTGSWIDPATGKPRYIPLEIKPTGATQPIYGETLRDAGIQKPPVLRHKRGAISMARSSEPNSASSQFYFALANLEFLDGDYAVFGYVTQGIGVVNKIKQGDRIQSVRVTKGLENFKPKG